MSARGYRNRSSAKSRKARQYNGPCCETAIYDSDGEEVIPRKARRRNVPSPSFAPCEETDLLSDDDVAWVVDDEAPLIYESDAESEDRTEYPATHVVTLSKPRAGKTKKIRELICWCMDAVAGNAAPMSADLRKFAGMPMALAEGLVDGVWKNASFLSLLSDHPFLDYVAGVRNYNQLQSDPEARIILKSDSRCALCSCKLRPKNGTRCVMRMYCTAGAYRRDDFYDTTRLMHACEKAEANGTQQAPVCLHAFCSQRADWVHAGLHWFPLLMMEIRAKIKELDNEKAKEELASSTKLRYKQLLKNLSKLPSMRDTTLAGRTREVLGQQSLETGGISPAYRPTKTL